MGLTQSSGVPEGGTEGYHVHGVSVVTLGIMREAVGVSDLAS